MFSRKSFFFLSFLENSSWLQIGAIYLGRLSFSFHVSKLYKECFLTCSVNFEVKPGKVLVQLRLGLSQNLHDFSIVC